MADSIGFVPNYLDEEGVFVSEELALGDLPQLGEEQQFEAPAVAYQPTRIIIPSLNKDLPLQNPVTRNIDSLTEVLKTAPARYIDSAMLGEKGNMILFGHSSHLPVVKNQMYKAFNDIEFLTEGDTIIVMGGGSEYLYRVTGVREVDAREGIIDLSKDRARLTLVTCNTFGEKTARWIVEAEFIGITG